MEYLKVSQVEVVEACMSSTWPLWCDHRRPVGRHNENWWKSWLCQFSNWGRRHHTVNACVSALRRSGVSWCKTKYVQERLFHYSDAKSSSKTSNDNNNSSWSFWCHKLCWSMSWSVDRSVLRLLLRVRQGLSCCKLEFTHWLCVCVCLRLLISAASLKIAQVGIIWN